MKVILIMVVFIVFVILLTGAIIYMGIHAE